MSERRKMCTSTDVVQQRSILHELQEIQQRVLNITTEYNKEADEEKDDLDQEKDEVRKKFSQYEDSHNEKDEILLGLQRSFECQIKAFMFDGQDTAAVLANTRIPEEVIEDLKNQRFRSDCKVNKNLLMILKVLAEYDKEQLAKFAEILQKAESLPLEDKMAKIGEFFSQVTAKIQHGLLDKLREVKTTEKEKRDSLSEEMEQKLKESPTKDPIELEKTTSSHFKTIKNKWPRDQVIDSLLKGNEQSVIESKKSQARASKMKTTNWPRDQVIDSLLKGNEQSVIESKKSQARASKMKITNWKKNQRSYLKTKERNQADKVPMKLKEPLSHRKDTDRLPHISQQRTWFNYARGDLHMEILGRGHSIEGNEDTQPQNETTLPQMSANQTAVPSHTTHMTQSWVTPSLQRTLQRMSSQNELWAPLPVARPVARLNKNENVIRGQTLEGSGRPEFNMTQTTLPDSLILTSKPLITGKKLIESNELYLPTIDGNRPRTEVKAKPAPKKRMVMANCQIFLPSNM